MNSNTMDRSLNGTLSLSDGDLTIEGGVITFSDGSILNSVGDIALLSDDNTFTGSNTFNNNIIAPTAPTLTTNLTNKAYVDDSIATSITNLKNANNTFTGLNTFSGKLTTNGISNTGNIDISGNFNSNNLIYTTGNAYIGQCLKNITATPIYTSASTNANFSGFTLNVSSVSDPLYNYALGTYNVSTSSRWDGSYEGYLMFNISSSNKWVSGSGTYNITTGLYNGSRTTTTTTGTITGEYNTIQLPYLLKADAIKIRNLNVFSMCKCKDFSLVASTDGTTWIELLSSTVPSSAESALSSFLITNSNFYNYFRIIMKNGSRVGLTTYTACGISVLYILGDIKYNPTITNTLEIYGNTMANGDVVINGATNIDGIVQILNNSGSDGYGYGALQLTQGGLYAHEISCFNKQLIVNDELRGNYMSLSSSTISTSPTTGALVVAGGVGVEGNVVSNTSFCIPNDFYGSGYISEGIYEGMYKGNGDGCSSTIQNLKIKSWNGIGFVHSSIAGNPTQDASIYMDVRAGVITNNYSVINQTLSVGAGATITGLIKSPNATDNKKWVLWDASATEITASAVNFYGFGINSSVLRYQTAQTTNLHRFYCNSTLNLEVGNGTVNVPVALSVAGTSQFNSTATINSSSSLYFHDLYRGIKSSFTAAPFITATSKPANGTAIWGHTDGCLGTSDGGNKSALFWNSSSQVGINTMSPSNTLDVNGSFAVSGLTSLNGGATITGVLKTSNSEANKKIVLYDVSPSDPVITASNFYGFGINSGTLRYQVPASTDYHMFMGGSTTVNLILGAGLVNIPLTTASTSSLTGALKVAGGVGIEGDLFCRNIRSRAKGIGSIGPTNGTYTDFYTFPEGGVYLFYINRCGANGAGVSSADGQDMNTSRVLMISCANVQVITQLGSVNGYVNITTGSNSLKLTAAITGSFTYTYWWHRFF